MNNCIKKIEIFVDGMYDLDFNKDKFNDELIITASTIECKRTFVLLDEYILWKKTCNNPSFESAFSHLSDIIKDLKQPLIAACDQKIATITLTFEDGSIVKEEYFGSLSDNDMKDLSKEILKLIPAGCFYPNFIE